MYTNPDEAAYCINRIARSEALAAASTDRCARASHVGIAEAYGDRLTSLTRSLIHPRRAGATLVETTVDA
jgi:hypothetical protein